MNYQGADKYRINARGFAALKGALPFAAILLLTACAGATGNITSTDPIERGLSYIAAAIVTHGAIQAIFRK